MHRLRIHSKSKKDGIELVWEYSSLQQIRTLYRWNESKISRRQILSKSDQKRWSYRIRYQLHVYVSIYLLFFFEIYHLSYPLLFFFSEDLVQGRNVESIRIERECNDALLCIQGKSFSLLTVMKWWNCSRSNWVKRLLEYQEWNWDTMLWWRFFRIMDAEFK